MAGVRPSKQKLNPRVKSESLSTNHGGFFLSVSSRPVLSCVTEGNKHQTPVSISRQQNQASKQQRNQAAHIPLHPPSQSRLPSLPQPPACLPVLDYAGREMNSSSRPPAEKSHPSFCKNPPVPSVSRRSERTPLSPSYLPGCARPSTSRCACCCTRGCWNLSVSSPASHPSVHRIAWHWPCSVLRSEWSTSTATTTW